MPAAKRAPKVAQIKRTTNKVLEATADLLSEVGFRGLTIDLVSKRSGVARSTIYRHWKTVPELTRDAFDFAIGPTPEPQETGDIRADLISLYRGVAKSLKRSVWGKLLPALIEASHNDPDFKGLLMEMTRERREPAKQLLLRAVKRGDLAADANVEWMLDALAGPLYHRLLITGQSVESRSLITTLVDGVLHQYQA